MTNQDFLQIITCSFKTFLKTGSRSNEKLKILHGAIAKDLQDKLGDKYQISSLGFGDGKESSIKGRYIDKMVDITIHKDGKAVAGIGVKFVMQNYAQNSNNYFENMLGETANIRSKNIPYFQIFIVPDKMPYYNNDGAIQKWEEFNVHNAEKYIVLSTDNIELMAHTPTKTLLFVIHLPEVPSDIIEKSDYKAFFEGIDGMKVVESNNSYGDFSNSVIYNDYEDFIEKVSHYLLFQG